MGTRVPVCRYRRMVGTSQTVLLIEDEPIIRLGTSAMLEDAGYCVLEAANANEALAALQAHPEIAVVLTDVQMPGPMDGLALADLLQRDRPHIRVLITSGRTGAREVNHCGSARFLSKPYTAAALEQALDSFPVNA